jgi:hypothetical protein
MHAYPAYWIEVAKHAYADGNDEALDVINWIITFHDQNKPVDSLEFFSGVYNWFYWLWNTVYWFKKDGEGNSLIPEDIR